MESENEIMICNHYVCHMTYSSRAVTKHCINVKLITRFNTIKKTDQLISKHKPNYMSSPQKTTAASTPRDSRMLGNEIRQENTYMTVNYL